MALLILVISLYRSELFIPIPSYSVHPRRVQVMIQVVSVVEHVTFGNKQTHMITHFPVS